MGSCCADVEVVGPGRMRTEDTLVVVTPEEWREHVIRWEVACRTDHGIDAKRPGQGPAWAERDLEQIIAADDPAYVVWWRGDLHPSSREELPPI